MAKNVGPKKPRGKRAKGGKGGKRNSGPGFFARMAAARKAKSRGRRGKTAPRAKSRGRRSPGHSPGSALILVGGGGVPQAIHPRPVGRAKGGKRGGSKLAKRGEKMKTTEILVNGLLVVAGTGLAVEIDRMITVKPLGLNPSVYALGASVAVAIVARRHRKIRNGAAMVATGLAAGMVGKALVNRSTSGAGGGPSV